MYFITAIERIPDEGGLNFGNSRCFGYYTTFDQADKAVQENWCNMHECLYTLVVIEAIAPGIHHLYRYRWFYQYNFTTDSFSPIEEPKNFNHLCNFALG